MLREATQGLEGEERVTAMIDKAENLLNTLSDAIDEVEKDITYNPREFLGIPLYPDSIWGFVSLLLTTALALLQSTWQDIVK